MGVDFEGKGIAVMLIKTNEVPFDELHGHDESSLSVSAFTFGVADNSVAIAREYQDSSSPEGT